ncbi:MAG: ribosomal-processing cysteine protease Prp [Clostridia bacterium]|nr:ribosomal-processing cysteine protease Prp [Clostridia bacterium]
MTSVKFLADSKGLYGFEISGHSSLNCDDEIGKIVCSAVSSAAYMTANTITEIIGCEADIVVDDAKMFFSLVKPTYQAVNILEGLRLHLVELSSQYSNNIKIIGGAKNVKD